MDAQGVVRVIKEPIFVATFDGGADGRFFGGQTSPGKRHGPAQTADGILDVRQGGHVTFPHDARFDLAQPLSVECRVWFDKPGKIPVIVSCGHWNQAGWFLQRFGNTWRWHVGGVDCDGGRAAENRWFHLAATYDGHTARLYEDGKLVAEQTGQFNTTPWPGDLHIGQYSAQPGPDFQVSGRIKDVKIYHRPLEAEEVARAAQARPK